jgi:hypothetical protein
MAVGAPHLTLHDLFLDGCSPKTAKSQFGHSGTFHTSHVIKVQDQRVIFAAVHTCMTFQVIPQKASAFLNDSRPPLFDLWVDLGPVGCIVVGGALFAARLEAILPFRPLAEVAERLPSLACGTSFQRL